MFKRFQRVSLLPALLLCFLLLLMTACSSTPTNSGVQAASTPAGSQSTPATNGTQNNNGGSSQMPQTNASCPAANTARAAVMRPLALGSHQNLVYIYNDVPANTTTSSGVLRRYNTATGQKANIATSGLRIDQAQVSADGQWVLFLSVPDPRGDSQHSAMLQLVRMDGQGLQTLYCFSNTVSSIQNGASRLPISLQWSVDQKSILFSVDTNHDTSQIFLLDVASGSLRELLNQHDPLYSYSVVTWLDATNFYVIKQGRSAPTPPATVFLMNASTATAANPGMVNILTTVTRMSDFSVDSSSDGAHLYNSSCLLMNAPLFSTSIMAGPAKGGARSTFFKGTPQDCVQVLRVIAPNKLLVLAQVATEAGNAFSNDVWTLNTTPGANYNVVSILSVSPGDSTRYDFNETTQFTWSNVSRDNSFYALQASNPSAKTQSILIGSLNGGNAQAIATTSSGLSTVSLAGWTTM